MGRLHPAAAVMALSMATPFTSLVAAAQPASVQLAAVRDSASGHVRVEYRLPEGVNKGQAVLYRSYLDLTRMGALDAHADPISRFDLGDIPSQGSWTDSLAADGISYWYYLKVKDAAGATLAGPAAKVDIPRRALEQGACDQGCILFVDKARYLLEVRRGEETLKRYPISLGRNPLDRKLHQDNSTTPEGIYKIAYVKPKSQFHKAYGIDYPNAEDRARYQRARKEGTMEKEDGAWPDIGGAVQIHGGGTGNNWTWGCMAMENDHIDELFLQKGIRAGTALYIAGKEVKRGDLQFLLRKRPGLARNVPHRAPPVAEAPKP